MKIDVLFLFHKEFDICRENLKRLRKFNKDLRVFALYGGPLSEIDRARSSIESLVDDFFVFKYEKDALWKWKHIDQMVVTWFTEKGRFLQWETIFIMHWDMLILAPIQNIFYGLHPGEILLSGLRPLNTVRSWWPWAEPNNPDLNLFEKLLHDKFNYEGELFACLFIVVCLPRKFLEQYVAAGHPEIGFLEYKIPTFAHIFGTPFCQNHVFQPWWASNPATKNAPIRQRSLNAVSQEVPRSVIVKDLARKNGRRLFHPVTRNYPIYMESIYIALILSCLYPFIKLISKIKKLIREKL